MSGFRPKKETTPQASEAPPPSAGKAVHETPDAVKRAGAKIRTAVLLAFFVFTVGWVFGVRVHLDALKPVAAEKPETVLELANGQSVVGKVVSERADSLIFLMEGSEVPFSRDEIKNLRPATAGEASLQTVGGGKRLFTVHPQDSLRYKLKNDKDLF